jgi:hypothetical protein
MSYENMELFVKKFQYEKYNWNVIGHLEVIPVLFDLQLGCTK